MKLRILTHLLLALALPLSIVGAEEENRPETVVPVQIGEIVMTNLFGYITAYGMVEPESATSNKHAASMRVASPSIGIVIEANAVEGERVAKGAVLFRLDSRMSDAMVEKAKQSVERAKPVVKLAEQNVDRQKRLLKLEGTSQKLMQEAEAQLAAARNESAAAQAELAVAQTQRRALLKIEAPFSGTLVRVNTKPGEAVEPNTVLAELVDLDRLVVSVGVPSAELAGVKPGQTAEITSGGIKATGKVTFISPQVDAKTDTATVRVAIPADASLRPGQFAVVRIVAEERMNTLAAPRASVVRDGGGNPVIYVVEGNKATQMPVKTGLRDGEWIEVEGDRVVNIRVRVDPASLDRMAMLRNLPLRTADGAVVKLSQVTDMVEEPGQLELRREDLRQTVAVTARLEGRDLGSAMDEIRAKLSEDKSLPPGVIEFGGLYQQQQESFRNLMLVLAMAIALVFTVLLIEFRSFYEPTAIVFGAVLALFGSVLALWLTHTSLNIISFLGAIIGVGIVAKNGILMLDYVDRLTAKGVGLEESLVLSGHRRLRPVLMTSLAAGLGMLPLAYGVGNGADMLKPLAIAVIGALCISVLLSLIATPVVYRLMRGS
jgi:RND family efflux transporter MFP subunit